MNTCDTCKWWQTTEIDGRVYPIGGSHKYCHNEKLKACDEEDGLNDNADTFYGLTTGPRFGCVHHEPK